MSESRAGLFRVLDLKREYPDKFYRILHPANPADDQALLSPLGTTPADLLTMALDPTYAGLHRAARPRRRSTRWWRGWWRASSRSR